MNNEPVAYGKYIENAKMWLVVELDADMPEGYIPLYTHPVKELTDEEIMNIFNNWTNSKHEHNLPAGNIDYFHQEMREFARAILRKAQE